MSVVCCHADQRASSPSAVNREQADDWPEFRGAGGQGHSLARGLPIIWSETQNIAWKVPIPGLGWSSPVIGGKKIWLTTAVREGRLLRALCLDRDTGQLLRDVEVFPDNAPGRLHGTNSYASPTPVLDGDRVYVHFGPHGTACLASDGKILWKTCLAYAPGYGPSSTPVLYEDLLIVPCQGVDGCYTAALDKQTGAIRWKQPHQGRNSDSTPLIVRTPAGDQLVCSLAERVVAYDPRTGKELWSASQGNNYAQVPRPVYGHGLVFVAGGYFEPRVQAIRPDGHGDVSQTHVAWSHRQAVPQNPSPLLAGGELYLVNDKGVASCLDARTGTLHWRERLGESFYASPIVADGRIYFPAEDGVTTVIEAGTRFKKLATNKLDGRMMASPAVAGKAIYLRTDRHLYRIESR